MLRRFRLAMMESPSLTWLRFLRARSSRQFEACVLQPLSNERGELPHLVEHDTCASTFQRIDLSFSCMTAAHETQHGHARRRRRGNTGHAVFHHHAAFGRDPMVRAAARYTSGAGFGFGTLSAQNRRSPKKRTRPVRLSTASTYDVKLLLAQALRN